MKTLALMLAFVASTFSAIAQSVPTEKEALKDAEYVLRRFDELTANIDFNRLAGAGEFSGAGPGRCNSGADHVCERSQEHPDKHRRHQKSKTC